jgi:hypothetical protein
VALHSRSSGVPLDSVLLLATSYRPDMSQRQQQQSSNRRNHRLLCSSDLGDRHQTWLDGWGIPQDQICDPVVCDPPCHRAISIARIRAGRALPPWNRLSEVTIAATPSQEDCHLFGKQQTFVMSASAGRAVYTGAQWLVVSKDLAMQYCSTATPLRLRSDGPLWPSGMLPVRRARRVRKSWVGHICL